MGFARIARQILAGTTLIAEAIQSQNYVPGSAGWAITAAGDAEFNDATMRGQVIVGDAPTGSGVEITSDIPAELTAYYVTGGRLSSLSDFAILMYDGHGNYAYTIAGFTPGGACYYGSGIVFAGTVFEAYFFAWDGLSDFPPALELNKLVVSDTTGKGGVQFDCDVLIEKGAALNGTVLNVDDLVMFGNSAALVWTSGGQRLADEWVGMVHVTPGVGGTAPLGSTTQVFPFALKGNNFFCQVSANSSVPGTVVEVSYTGLTSTQVTIWMNRSTVTSTSISVHVKSTW